VGAAFPGTIIIAVMNLIADGKPLPQSNTPLMTKRYFISLLNPSSNAGPGCDSVKGCYLLNKVDQREVYQ